MDNNFEKIADMARDVVDVVTKKTDELVSTSKLRIKRSNLSGELRDAYQKLGGAVYESKSCGADNDELITLITTEIDEIVSAIDKIDKQLQKISSSLKCAVCGTVNSKEALYCQHCGSILPKSEECGCDGHNDHPSGESCCNSNVNPAPPTEEDADKSSEELDDDIF